MEARPFNGVIDEIETQLWFIKESIDIYHKFCFVDYPLRLVVPSLSFRLCLSAFSYMLTSRLYRATFMASIREMGYRLLPDAHLRAGTSKVNNLKAFIAIPF
jgi:hypothetical protein